MQIQSWVGIFAQITPNGAPIAGSWAFNGLCDDEGLPLICPTCQILAQSVGAGDCLLLCMGLFSIFSLGATATRLRDIVLEAAHANQAFAVPRDSNSRPSESKSDALSS